jgi:hypothetical protein
MTVSTVWLERYKGGRRALRLLTEPWRGRTVPSLRMVVVEGENADGVTVEKKNIERTGAGGPETRSGPDQVISAILGTQERAAENGYQLRSTGVTWTYPNSLRPQTG